MARYWCGWCGETAIAPQGIDVPCARCAAEFTRLLGYTPRTSMEELLPGEEPGIPAAATKRFTFFDAVTGEVIGRTAAASAPKKQKRGLHIPVTTRTSPGNQRSLASQQRKEEPWTC